ncbi:hypothetical protein ACH41H_16150 [Streptomyces sp. NPDC020800]|uniref:hypothetical protein n=1 Tax=Streptomyces sp. NPDC020800 TaxID=3365092 RepID=UPI00378B062E
MESIRGINNLEEGQEYAILEVFVPRGNSALFRIEFNESEDPALFDSRVFEVTSPSLPSSWRYFQFESGSFALRPEPWGESGFWEAFYDRDPRALEVYESEKQKILSQRQPE